MSQVTVLLIGTSLLTGIMTIVTFIVFRIPHMFFYLTGIGAKREIKRIARGDFPAQVNSAGISFSETTILSERDKNETVVLSAEDVIDGLSFKENTSPQLIIKKDIVIKDGMKRKKD